MKADFGKSGNTGKSRGSESSGFEFPGVLRQNDKRGSDMDRPDGSSAAAVEPSTAMYHSMMFAGWGQLDNGKKKKAAMFFIAEMVCIGGYFYVSHEINNGDYSDFQKNNLRTDRNTFVLYWMVSKVFGLVDAYVDAQLGNYDVENITPEELLKEK
ncbi:hypothetical protein ACFL6P_05195 [Candidatus Latescibacterota bacterium]